MSLLATVYKEQELILSLSYNFLVVGMISRLISWFGAYQYYLWLISRVFSSSTKRMHLLQDEASVGVETGFYIFRTPPDRNRFRHLPFLRGNYFPCHYLGTTFSRDTLLRFGANQCKHTFRGSFILSKCRRNLT